MEARAMRLRRDGGRPCGGKGNCFGHVTPSVVVVRILEKRF